MRIRNINSTSAGVTRLMGAVKLGAGAASEDRAGFDVKSFSHAWTVKGKTNEDGRRDALLDLKGGKNLKLNNVAYSPGSGYEDGYLHLDGVDDFMKTDNFAMGLVWTIVGEFRFAESAKANSRGIDKYGTLTLENSTTGMSIYMNSINYSSDLAGKKVMAVCSDGRVYLDNWEMVDASRKQDSPGSTGGLFIGKAAYGSQYAEMYFKNLAIYDNVVLSEDDCRSCYDYLQTLKEK